MRAQSVMPVPAGVSAPGDAAAIAALFDRMPVPDRGGDGAGELLDCFAGVADPRVARR